jgi:hypothetical protein
MTAAKAPEARAAIVPGDEVIRLSAFDLGDGMTWEVRAGPRLRDGRWEVGIWSDRLGWRLSPVRRLVLARAPETPQKRSDLA